MPRSPLPALVLVLTLTLLPSLAAAIALQPAAVSAAPPGPRVDSQWWAGTLSLPGPQGPIPVGVVLCLVPDASAAQAGQSEGWAGSFDLVPGAGTLGVSAVECERVELTPTSLTFVVGPPVSATIQLMRPSPDAAEFTGEATIAGLPPLPTSLRLVTRAEAMSRMIPRPQTPRPPFPYAREEVEVASTVDSVSLAGTLTFPAGPGPHPAVILISDGGAQDRDHSGAHHRPFLVIADFLTRRGFAVLRLDDRGAGRTPGVPAETTVDMAAADVRSAAAMLAGRGDIDAERITALGIGEGALVGAMAAAESDAIAALVLLSPPGLPGKEIALLREVRRMEAEGEDPAFIRPQSDRARKVLDLVTDGASQEAIAEAVRELVLATAGALRGDGVVPEDWQLQQASAQQAFYYTSPAMKRWLTLDPAGPLEKLRVPVLAIAGDLNLVVTTQDSFPKVAAALERSGAAVTLKRYPSLNHWLQPATTGFSDEGASIHTTIHPDVLDEIAAWLEALPGR